jgi:hypothetical protein
MLANRPIHSVEPRTGFVQAHVTWASDPQLAMSRGLWAPNRRFEGAQRAPNWLVQGSRGPLIEKVSANTEALVTLGGGRQSMSLKKFSGWLPQKRNCCTAVTLACRAAEVEYFLHTSAAQE